VIGRLIGPPFNYSPDPESGQRRQGAFGVWSPRVAIRHLVNGLSYAKCTIKSDHPSEVGRCRPASDGLRDGALTFDVRSATNGPPQQLNSGSNS
jgi:hypothetical protein